MEKKRDAKEILYYDEEAALEINKQITNAYQSGVIEQESGDNTYYPQREVGE